MNEYENSVQRLFPNASTRFDGIAFRVDGVPGIVAIGRDEDYAWATAAGELLNPVKNSSRLQLVRANVTGAFNALGGQVNRHMALVARLEATGWTASESTAAVNEMLAEAVLLVTESGGIRLA